MILRVIFPFFRRMSWQKLWHHFFFQEFLWKCSVLCWRLKFGIFFFSLCWTREILFSQRILICHRRYVFQQCRCCGGFPFIGMRGPPIPWWFWRRVRTLSFWGTGVCICCIFVWKTLYRAWLDLLFEVRASWGFWIKKIIINFLPNWIFIFG